MSRKNNSYDEMNPYVSDDDDDSNDNDQQQYQNIIKKETKSLVTTKRRENEGTIQSSCRKICKSSYYSITALVVFIAIFGIFLSINDTTTTTQSINQMDVVNVTTIPSKYHDENLIVDTSADSTTILNTSIYNMSDHENILVNETKVTIMVNKSTDNTVDHANTTLDANEAIAFVNSSNATIILNATTEIETKGNVSVDTIASDIKNIILNTTDATIEKTLNDSNMTSTLLNDENTIILNASYDDIIETVQVVFGNLQYRRVCTSVGLKSVLCMTIRFPFPVPLQVKNESIRYPKPVQSRFYEQDKNNIATLSWNDWIVCNNNNTNNTNNNMTQIMMADNDTIIQQCLVNKSIEIANNRKDKQEPVISIWTRQRPQSSQYGKYNNNNQEIIFHGVGSEDNVNNMFRFFGNDHEIIVMGASPAPGVTEANHWMLGGKCQQTTVGKWPNYNCDNPYTNNSDKITGNNRRRRIQRKNYTELEEGHINFGIIDFRIRGISALESLNNTVLRANGWNNTLRNLSVIVEYPFAHVQNQDWFKRGGGLGPNMYINNPRIRWNQNLLPSYFIELLLNNTTIHFNSRGYQFQHLLVFDGIPQFFPTETSGFTENLFGTRQEYGVWNKNFTYNGWDPDYGTNCRGPLPSNSILRAINLLSRQSFLNASEFDNQWYGRTWEFFNLYWWQMRMYFGEFGLDCTHSGGYDGLYGVHKYFIQAMIDDYFENQ